MPYVHAHHVKHLSSAPKQKDSLPGMANPLNFENKAADLSKDRYFFTDTGELRRKVWKNFCSLTFETPPPFSLSQVLHLSNDVDFSCRSDSPKTLYSFLLLLLLLVFFFLLPSFFSFPLFVRWFLGRTGCRREGL